MNAAFVLLTSAWLAGADPAPPAAAPAPAPAPAVVSTGSACGGCGSSCGDPCCESHGRKKLLAGLGSRLKGKFRRGHHDCCEAAPTCCAAPAPTCCAPAPKPVCCAPAPKPVCCAPAPTCCPAPKPVCCAPAAPACDACQDECDHHRRHKLGGHLKGKFRRGHDECCGATDACGSSCCGGAIAPAPVPAAPAPGAEPKKMPTTIGGAPATIAPAKIRIEEGVRNPFDLARRYEGMASASPDYSKLTGQLFFVHTDGGRWVLRYAPISKEDRFGGSVILTRDIRIDAFHEGDLISVEGEVLAEKTTLPLGGALFRANTVNLVERGQGLTAQ